jgi:hypothetical protein
MPTWGLIYWPTYLMISLSLFLPVEVYALVTNQAQNTLSDYCWHELDVTKALAISGHGMAWWCSLILWGFFVVAITLHIWYRSV